ncbi:MAG: GNAT family N-acetyltransferase [Zetaproteobacteria bacterium]|nr:MAG: GNAT family N-acetyltransferase [Zetaproteobacteria bacterium]
MKSVQNQVTMIEKSVKNQNICEIEWGTLSVSEWDTHFCNVKRANLLQSLDYAHTMARLNHQQVRHGVIKINGDTAGLVQVLEAGLFRNAVHGVLLDRGPLWFDSYGSVHDFDLFLSAFSKQFPKRFGRRIRFLPEMENTEEIRRVLQKYGYKPASKKGYQTIWLDISRDLDVLRKKLKKKWRNKLNKSEKNGLSIVWSDKGAYFPWLIQHYTEDKLLRKYDGPAPKLVASLAYEFSRGQNMLIGAALLDGEPIAAILIFKHGFSATYQIGYTTEMGRNKCAHHLLLWTALAQLKERNINDFDLGGVNDKSAKGVKIFKEGLGGELCETLGLYH